MNNQKQRFYVWIVIALLFIGFDQLTKYWVQQALYPGQLITYSTFFDLVLVFNTGAAFSFLAHAGGWQMLFFSGIAFIVSAVILHQLWKDSSKSLYCLSLTGIMGGALGNVIDRIYLGKVVDFLQFHAGSHYWPAFNAADCFIVGGAILLVLDSLLHSKQKEAK